MCSALTVSAVRAEHIAVDLDATRTQILWFLEGNMHTVHGTFRLKYGHLDVDTATGRASGDLIADAASGESGNSSRDRRMQGNILQSGRFPEIRLEVKGIEGPLALSGHSTVRLKADFLILGARHPITIPIEVPSAAQKSQGWADSLFRM